jgi:predicted RNA-binding Zn ribbon-like protein
VEKFEFIGGALCLDFLNTVHHFGAAEPGDELQTLDDLLAWGREAKLLRPQEVSEIRRQFQSNPKSGEEALGQAKRVRSRLRQLFGPAKRGLERKDIAALNSWLKQHSGIPAVVRDATAWRLAWRPASAGLERLLFEILVSAAKVVTDGPRERIRECASPICTWLFVDTSKNHRRRWCDMQVCGNRAKVRSFRLRHAERVSGSRREGKPL